ncbi:hypothetical protein C5167_026907 [Papaver somniferum]|uniref:uncharacterized protein LOC113341333 n=1 Tax=Papaver somniferum TaxID=3469 RepID=UPI000E6FCBC2|nr:uncharacterized protein LOC113341333 [Papaver somniferum]RZC92273.1 hypothetical protein C5167_026907 [Papaver somniferum]
MATPTNGINSAQPERGLSVFTQNACPIGRDPVKMLTKEEIDKAHSYVLINCVEVQPYLDKYRDELQVGIVDNSSGWQQKNFAQWFKQHMMTLRYQESEEATNELFSLACGPQSTKSYPCCVINGVCFWVRRDKRLTAPNPGLHILRKIEDKVIELFGLATNVIELVYKLGMRVVLFTCEWFNTNPNENLIEMENNLVNICVSSKWYGDNPFVLANEAVQVFYVDDQKCRPNWRLVQGPKPINRSKNESNRNSAALAQSIENIFDGEHKRVRTAPQHSTSVSCTTSSQIETGKEQPKEFVGTLETELESERALWSSQKAELESRRALAQVQKAELDCQRALILSRKVELESHRALTLSQKAELESQKTLSQRQQKELESQRLLTKYQQAELESTQRLIQGQNQLYQDQQQLLKDQQERLKHFENLFT